MKITIFSTSDFPYKGASENFVRLMSFGLKYYIKNIQITRFWGSRFNNINDTNIECSNYLFNKPFNGFFLKTIETFIQIIYLPIYLFRLKFKNKNNVLLLYGVDRIYIILPMLIFSKLLNINCYRIITEEYPLNKNLNYFFRYFIKFSEQLQTKYIDKYMDGIIVLSKYLKSKAINNNVDPKKIIIINHFIQILDVYNKNNIKSSNKFIIGFSGSLTLENGIIDLINSFIYLNNKYPDQFLLLVIGEIPDNLIKYKIHKSIIFTGYLIHHEALKQLYECNVLVNASKEGILSTSGFPTKLAEYLATGIPVITSNVGDLNEYFIDNKEVFFFDSNSSNALSEKIYNVYLNIEFSKQVGFNGKLWAKNNLDYKINAKKLLNFLKITQ